MTQNKLGPGLLPASCLPLSESASVGTPPVVPSHVVRIMQTVSECSGLFYGPIYFQMWKGEVPPTWPKCPPLGHSAVARRAGPGKATVLSPVWVRWCHLNKDPGEAGKKLGHGAQSGSS